MRTLPVLASLTLVAIVAVACGNQQAPAEAALKVAENAYAAVRAEAEKYAPDQARAIQDSLTSAKAALGKSDYAGVMQQAQALTTKISGLGGAIAAKKSELTKAWTAMSTEMPKMVDAVKAKVDTLSKSARLPAGVTKEALANAKSGLATTGQHWAEALAAAASGDVSTAVSKARSVQASLANMMQSLNMQARAATGS
jgi:hypothetical protein